uniref:Putative secreted protein n=1 Tax=Ixodes ricinus TaxID=34613 RepID=V5IFA8_IXORI
MRSSFIFCLLAMYCITSANATPCWDVPPCHLFCPVSNGGYEFRTKASGTPCTTLGRKPGECKNGQCENKK